jgi:hypothetical protein
VCAGESGKSTIFKQLNHLYNNAFSDEDTRKQFKSIVHYNLLTSMKTLIEQSRVLGTPITAADALDAAKGIVDCPVDAAPSPAVYGHLKILWKDPVWPLRRCGCAVRQCGSAVG